MSRLTINSSIPSLNAQRSLSNATKKLGDSYTRLSSGLRINKSSDDAAGLSIATGLKSDARIYNQSIRNLNDGISALNIAESAGQELSNILTRIAELAEQSANGANSNTQRKAINKEGRALRAEYNRILSTTKFNGISLINGDAKDIKMTTGEGGLTNAIGLGLEALDGGESGTGRGITLDGVNDYVEITDTEDLKWRGKDLTIEAFVKIDSAEADSGDIVSRSWHGGGVYNYRLIWDNPSSAFGVWIQSESGDYFNFNVTASVQRDEWNHIALTISKDKSVNLWLNGENIDSRTHTVTDFSNQGYIGGPVTVGTLFPYGEGWVGNSTYSFRGSVDQVRISNNVRYTESFDPSRNQLAIDQNTAALVNFEETSGLSIVNSVPGSTNGILRNGATRSDGYNPNNNILSPFSLLGVADALDTLDLMKSSIMNLSKALGDVGATQSRFSVAISNLSTLTLNYNSASSQILDVDVAEESSRLAATQILQQSSASILAQANQQPRLVLSLLGDL